MDNPDITTLKATNRDGEELTATFQLLNYNIIPLKNEQVTVDTVQTVVMKLSAYLKEYNAATDDGTDPTYKEVKLAKAIVFAFSGHGTTDNRVIANDGGVIFLRDVVKPLVDPSIIGHHSNNIPKLFFIDACRGLYTIEVPEPKGEFQTDVNDIQGNFNIEFATIEGHKAFTESWMPVLATALKEKNDTYQNIMATARERTHQKYHLQQAQTHGQLAIGKFKLYY